MPSALAIQIAKGTSLNAPLLSDSARKKHFATSSYLFSASTKGQIDDLDTIHALAFNALSQLKQIYSAIAAFDEQSLIHRALFSHRAKETDRTLLSQDELAELNAALKTCLAALGPCLMENAAGRVLEWLVRRFRINEFNVPEVLALFLPYHEAPHFAKMVSILTIDENTAWRFLSTYKASGKPIQRSALVTCMLSDRELARFIVSMLPEALATSGGRNVHRTLVCFNTSVILEYVRRSEKRDLDAPVLAFLLPALTEPLKIVDYALTQSLRKDSILGSFILLAALSHKCTFTMAAVKTIASGMIHCASATSLIGAYQLLTALISFLGPQRSLEEVSPKIVDELLALPDFSNALESSLEWAGIEKLAIPILVRTTQDLSNDNHLAIVQMLIAAKHPQRIVLLDLAKKLLLTNKDAVPLAELYQRHPDVVRAAIRELDVAGDEKGTGLEQTLTELAMPPGLGNAPHDVVLASSNADPSIRTSTVGRIIEILAGNSREHNSDEYKALQEALLARVYDTETNVLNVLYAAPAVLAPLLASTPDVLPKLAASLSERRASRTVLRAHLSFFCNAFVSAYPGQAVRIALTLVLPNALFTKPRRKTAAAVWDVVAKSVLGQGNLFKGTLEIIDKTGDELAQINDALTNQLAENVRISNEFPEIWKWLVETASTNGDAHARLFSLLVIRNLFAKLSGENRIDAALKFMDTINIANTSGLDKVGEDQSTLDEEVMSKNVVLKPNSPVTTRRIQFIILVSIARSARPLGRELEWFRTEHNVGNDRVDVRYLVLQTRVYSIINSVAAAVDLSLHANGALFEVLGTDSLLFLARIWTFPPAVEGIDQDATRYVALRHALAFLRAQTAERLEDFQTVLPSLLLALQASDKRVRAAAMDCTATMATSSAGSKPSSIYVYDKVYGSSSANLQYLDWSDELKYLSMLVEHRDHIINDPEYLVLFHHKHFSRTKAENKKDSKYRSRVLCYLLSHVLCCPSLPVKVHLLRSISRVSNAVKLQMLLPTIETMIESPPLNGSERDMEILALRSFDSSAAKEFNAEESRAWAVLMRSIDRYLSDGGLTEQWTCLRSTIRDGLFSVFSVRRQVEVSLKLIEIGSRVREESGIKQLLVHCIQKPALIVTLLQSLRPNIETLGERATKRAKIDEAYPDSGTPWLSRLTLLAEVLSSKKVSGSPELIQALLDTLNALVTLPAPSGSDVVYVEQLLLTCLESVISQTQELPILPSNTIRTDVLVEMIRTSENPQSFNQALLLLASLARLSPKSVLHNVMPVFTFMGSNVFHRDDSYSFKVIQKTTESIVPVAAASLREQYTGPLDLYIGSRDLLRTFTDASTHVPRHRRTSFFTHLVDVLGPEDYLAPVLMLLVDKSSNRASRQDRREAQHTLELPLSIMQHYASRTETSAAKEIIREVQRLTRVIDDPMIQERVFLEDSALEERAVPPSTRRKRQCQALLVLIGFGMKQISPTELDKSPSGDLQFLVTSLIELAILDSNAQTSSDLREVGNTAQWSLVQMIAVISAQFFSSTVLSMLSSDNKKIYQTAFSLLGSRVPAMKPETREEISPVLAQIIKRTSELVPSFQDTGTISEAMNALLSIGESSTAKEESALTSMMVIAMDIVEKHPGVSRAISVIHVLVPRLGPRVIPHFRSLITSCVSVVKSTDETVNRESVTSSINALGSLMKTVPTFWSVQEIKLVIELYLDEELANSKDVASHLEQLVKLLAKQLPSKVVLSSLLETWLATDELSRRDQLTRFVRFFDLVKRCLHFAARSDVLEHLRSLFIRFLQAFEARRLLTSTEAFSVEDRVIAAYLELIVKLNETSFQPLFRKLVDWAFSDTPSPEKQITFCRHYTALLELFKELMTPYMSLLVNNLVELLRSFEKEESVNAELWLASLEALSKSFTVDDGVYWRDDRLRIVSQPLTQQIPVCINLKITSGRTLLSEALSALVDGLEDDATLKAVNHAVLMHTRSEDAKIRILALQCSTAIWKSHGTKLRAFGSEAATFVIECAEDENDEVVRVCRQLKDAVQAEVGKIEGL